MRVGALISTLDQYNRYRADIAGLISERQLCEAYDDENGVIEVQQKIDLANEELGKFLDTEI